MKNIWVLIVMLVPSLLMADTKVDFEISLIGIQGQIDRYPLEFEMAVFCSSDIATLEFLNQIRESLSEEQIDELNQKRVISGKSLKMNIAYNVVVPSNPYFKPYPGFENVYREKHQYTLNDERGSKKRFDKFQVSVRTDAWGASSLSGSLPMEMLESMVHDSNLKEKRFKMQDDGVEYIFSIARSANRAVAECADGSCQLPAMDRIENEIMECDGTCVMK
ncbi:MAG: hypothetical protein R2877_00330 [Bdellovibrionota bacterium]